MKRLKGKVAIVTGAALGIGQACAVRLAEEEAAVALFDVMDAPGNALAEDLIRRGHRGRYWHVDVSHETEVRATIEAVVAHFGRLDILVNNAGIAGPDKPMDQVTEEEWDRVQAVNVKGVFFCTKHAVPALRRSGHGSVVNLSSIYGIIGAGDAPPYHASKGAVRVMSKNDAVRYAADNIRVNSIHPGFIATPMVAGFLSDRSDPAAAQKALEALHPLGHLGEPDDVAMGVVYLGSHESKFVTGSELVIDGGYTAR